MSRKLLVVTDDGLSTRNTYRNKVPDETTRLLILMVVLAIDSELLLETAMVGWYNTYRDQEVPKLTPLTTIVLFANNRTLLEVTVAEVEAKMRRMAVVPPAVKLVGTVKEAPTISRVEAPVMVRSAGTCRKYEGLVLANVKEPPWMLNRLPPPRTPEICMWTVAP